MKKIGDVANIVRSDGSTMQRVGDIWQGRSGGVLFRRAGSVKRFDQVSQSKSLRMDRVRIKEMIREAR